MTQNVALEKPLPKQPTGSDVLGSRNPWKRFFADDASPGEERKSLEQPSTSTSALDTAGASSSVNGGQRPSIEITPARSLSGVLNSSDNSTSQTHYSPPSGPPPGIPSIELPDRSSSATSNQPHRQDTLDLLTQDLPPPYTPGPDSLHGEQSVEFGPTRPFQNSQPARPPAGPTLSPRPSNGRYAPAPSVSGLIADLLTAAAASRHPGGSNYRTTTSQPFLSPQITGYGSPPSRSRTQYGGWSSYPGRPRSAPPSPELSPVANDGRPTLRPVPGHPLINDGEVLVYPEGFECHKCFNKGYKPVSSHYSTLPLPQRPGDPSKECRRCWRRYSRTYGPDLMADDWVNNAILKNYQRPIADTTVPQVNAPPTIAPLSPSITGSTRSGPGLQSSRSVVYSAGDPRIGGRRCATCMGEGRIPIGLFTDTQCPRCRGLGRTFS